MNLLRHEYLRHEAPGHSFYANTNVNLQHFVVYQFVVGKCFHFPIMPLTCTDDHGLSRREHILQCVAELAFH